MEVSVHQLQGNEFRRTPFKISKCKFCEYLEKDKFILPQVFKDFNTPYECPVKRGRRAGQVSAQANIPPNFDGTFKTVTNFYYLGELRETVTIVFEVHHYMMT
jgi:hypothetical protein